MNTTERKQLFEARDELLAAADLIYDLSRKMQNGRSGPPALRRMLASAYSDANKARDQLGYAADMMAPTND